MGTNPTNSAIDPRARVWGTEGLYVADAVRPPLPSPPSPFSLLTFVITVCDALSKRSESDDHQHVALAFYCSIHSSGFDRSK